MALITTHHHGTESGHQGPRRNRHRALIAVLTVLTVLAGLFVAYLMLIQGPKAQGDIPSQLGNQPAAGATQPVVPAQSAPAQSQPSQPAASSQPSGPIVSTGTWAEQFNQIRQQLGDVVLPESLADTNGQIVNAWRYKLTKLKDTADITWKWGMVKDPGSELGQHLDHLSKWIVYLKAVDPNAGTGTTRDIEVKTGQIGGAVGNGVLHFTRDSKSGQWLATSMDDESGHTYQGVLP